MGRSVGVDAVSYGDDGVEVVEKLFAANLACAFGLNYREFLGSCLFV